MKTAKKSRSRGKSGPLISISWLLRCPLATAGKARFEKGLVRGDYPISNLPPSPAQASKFPLDLKKLAEIGLKLCAAVVANLRHRAERAMTQPALETVPRSRCSASSLGRARCSIDGARTLSCLSCSQSTCENSVAFGKVLAKPRVNPYLIFRPCALQFAALDDMRGKHGENAL